MDPMPRLENCYVIHGDVLGVPARVGDDLGDVAAHCIYDDSNWKPYVVVGSHNKNTKTDKYEKSYNIAQVITHPRWNPKDITMYDIAILKTDKKITFNDGVQPICLPEATREWSDDSEFLVSGWGALKEDGS